MRPRALILCAFMLLALAVPSFAHSGGTDGNGGHYNRSTGEYHYHHGYSAHQHPDGICPYDYNDKTGESSGSSGQKKPDLTLKKIEPEKKAKGISADKISKFAKGCLIFLGALIAMPIMWEIVRTIKDKFKQDGRKNKDGDVMSLKRDINGTSQKRWKDPVAWDCLTDDQREIINSWYEQRCEEFRKETAFRDSRSWTSSVIALIPLAVIHAYGEYRDTSLDMFGAAAAVWLVYAFAYGIFRKAYEQRNPERAGHAKLVFHILVAIFASLCIAHLIYR